MTETATVEKLTSSHRKIYTDIVIEAPANQVWEVLKDTSSYKDWAAFMVHIDGDLKNGNTITAKFQLNPKKEKYNTIEHTIGVTEGESFYWAEKGPMGICDNHHFRIESIDPITSRFIQTDEISKGATWLLGGYLSKVYKNGYQAFNRNLKNEVESRYKKS
jgi:hypothetical protein